MGRTLRQSKNVKTRSKATGGKGTEDKGKSRKGKEKAKETENFEQNEEPFVRKWMNDCYKKLIFPNPNCIEVMEKINRTLPRHVLKAQMSEQKQQALFLLLGKDFTEHHFPKHKYDVEILNPPTIEMKQKEKYVSEMKAFLNEALLRTMEDCGYSRDLTQYQKSDDEMGKYLQEVRGTFREAFTTHVTLDAFEQETKHIQKIRRDAQKYKASNDSSDSDFDGTDGSNDKDDDKEPGVTYTQETDAAGRAFLDFMAHDDSKRNDYKKIIKSKQLCLPLSLRQYFWWDFFETKEKERLKLKSGDNMKMAILRDFEENLKQSMKKQKLTLATKSSNAKYIDSHVIELFEMSPPLDNLDVDDIMMKTTLVVNMVDIHSNNYSPVINLLLFPFHLTYKKRSKESTEDYMKYLGVQLSLFSKYAQLTQNEIFKLAKEVISKVEEEDPQYLHHIKKCLSFQSNRAKPLDFPPEVFLSDTRAGLKVFNNLLKHGIKGEEDVRSRYIDELSDPKLFIRKWIGQVFIGVLSVNGMMWAWDQIFLSNWSRETIKNIAISILALIKPWMLRASVYSGARKVFIEEPSKLYTSDLRGALNLLQNGSLFTQIPPTKNFVANSTVQQKSGVAERRKSMPTSPKTPKVSSSKPSTSRNKKDDNLLKPKWSVPVLPFGSRDNFGLDFHLKDPPDDDDEPVPIPEPSPDSESEPEEETERVRDPNEPPTPPDSPPPPLTEKGWVPKDLNPINPPDESYITDPFDIYVDYVRFLPDNIRVCKVTGKILNSDLPKGTYRGIVTYPLQESFQRSPAFKYKQTVNLYMEQMNPDTVIIFKVYGYQKSSKDVVAVGSCLLSPFTFSNDEYLLKAGGHQIRLRHGAPNPVGGLETLHESDMNHNSPIPGVSICVRLLKADKIYDPTPSYEDGYYESGTIKPNATELRLFYHYINMEGYSTLTVGDELRSIQSENKENEIENGSELHKYLMNLLDHSAVQKKKGAQVSELDYSSFVKYEQRQGVNVCIQGAFGLPESVEGYYIHAFGEVLPGRQTKYDVTDDERRKLQIVTRRLDLTSPQRSPDWLDLKTTMYPPYDDQSVLLVQIFGIKLKYLPTKEEKKNKGALTASGNEKLYTEIKVATTGQYNSSQGTIQQTEQGSFEIDYDNPLTWSIMPIFRDGFIEGGLHLLAVFEGKLDEEVISFFERDSPVEHVLKKCVAKGLIKPDKNSFMEVEVYDGRVESEDLPEPAIDVQLKALGIKDSTLQSRYKEFQAKFTDFVLENMDEADKSKGASGPKYEKESHLFQQESNLQFVLSLNKTLEEIGKPSVPF